MSKVIAMVVEFRASYPRGFADSYPLLHRYLNQLAPGAVGEEPSLFELAGRAEELGARLEGSHLAELFRAREPQLLRCHRRAEELAADWNLAAADAELYRVEDLFDEIEAELRTR